MEVDVFAGVKNSDFQSIFQNRVAVSVLGGRQTTQTRCRLDTGAGGGGGGLATWDVSVGVREHQRHEHAVVVAPVSVQLARNAGLCVRAASCEHYTVLPPWPGRAPAGRQSESALTFPSRSCTCAASAGSPGTGYVYSYCSEPCVF